MDLARAQSLLSLFAMVLIPLGVGGAGFLLLREASVRAQRRLRLSTGGVAAGTSSGPPGGMLAGAFDSVRRVGDRVAIRDPDKLSSLRARLMQAGFFNREAIAYYLGARMIALVIATIATLLLLPLTAKLGGMGAIAMVGSLALAALLGPDQVIKARIADREREYRDGFPDLLDLLVASVEAGLSLDAAVGRIAGELARRYPRLSEHLALLSL